MERMTPLSPAGLARRQLLSRGAVVAAGAAAPQLLPGVALARGGGDDGPAGAWPAAFADVAESYGPTEVRWTRPLPAGLAGTLYRNGPARMHRGPTSYRHWFDGDGMLQAYRFDTTTLRHQAKMIRTDKYVAEERAGRFLRPAFGTWVPGAQAAAKPDDGNVANINVLPVDGELLALWEAGSPYRVDPQTLETRGRKVWSPETDGVAFSAHPKIDRDGTIWSFGYLAGTGRLVLYRLDRAGAMLAVRLVETADADMIHDFAITDRWLVFVLMPLVFDREPAPQTPFMDRLQWQDRPGTVLLVDKHSLEIAHRIEIPATPFFHVGNAWDDGESVRVQVMAIDGFRSTMDALMAAMAGREGKLPPEPGPVEIVATPGRARGRVERLVDFHAEFPAIDPRHIAQPTRALFACARSASTSGGVFGFDSIVRIDRESGRTQRFDYGRDVLVEEHVFVARAGAGEGVGWLVGTARDHAQQQTLVSVFDATAVADGPIAQTRLPYGLPLGLHGAFVAA